MTSLSEKIYFIWKYLDLNILTYWGLQNVWSSPHIIINFPKIVCCDASLWELISRNIWKILFFTKIWSFSAKLSCQKFLRCMEQHIWKLCQFYAKSLCFHNIKKVSQEIFMLWMTKTNIKRSSEKYIFLSTITMFAGVGFQLSGWIFQLRPLPLMVGGRDARVWNVTQDYHNKMLADVAKKMRALRNY